MSQHQPSMQVNQIISGALISAVVMFALIAVAVRSSNVDPADVKDEQTLITMMAMGAVAMLLVARPAVLGAQDRATAQKLSQIPDPTFEQHGREFAGIYQTRTIIGMAMLEGPAMFAGVAYIIEGRAVALALMGFQVLNMLAAFPTDFKFQTWFENCRLRATEYNNTNASS